MIDYEIAFSYCFLLTWRTIIMIVIIITFQDPYDAPMFWQWNWLSKEVSFNYLHVICGIEERVSLDWFRSGNSRGLLLDKKSQNSYIFLRNFSLLRTLFSGLNNYVPYRTFLIQKLWYFFKLVKVNLIFHFQ